MVEGYAQNIVKIKMKLENAPPPPIPRQNLGPVDPLGGPFTSSLVQGGLGIGGKGVWSSSELVFKYNELN